MLTLKDLGYSDEDGKMFNVDNLTTIRQRLLANLPTGSEEI